MGGPMGGMRGGMGGMPGGMPRGAGGRGGLWVEENVKDQWVACKEVCKEVSISTAKLQAYY